MFNPMDITRLDRQIEDLQRMRANYQNMLNNPPINNIINTPPTSLNNIKPMFEARFTNDNPSDVLVQNKTAFIDLKNNKLTIKEVDGEIKEFGIIPPKDEKDIRIQQLENEINMLKENYINLQMNTIKTQPQTIKIEEQPAFTNSVETRQPIQETQNNKETSLEPIVYNLGQDEYSVSEQKSLVDKIGSKLKFKK